MQFGKLIAENHWPQHDTNSSNDNKLCENNSKIPSLRMSKTANSTCKSDKYKLWAPVDAMQWVIYNEFTQVYRQVFVKIGIFLHCSKQINHKNET